MRRPGASLLSRWPAAVSLWLVAVLVAPKAHAAGEPSPAQAVVEASVSRSTVLGRPWAPRTSYSVSLWGLWQAGQGVGARVSLLPPARSAGAWELSADAVARFTSEGPLYFKALGGAAIAPRPLWPPRLRVGGEAGVHAIRGSVGLEVGVAGVYSFPPSQLAQGQGVVSLGVGLLFGFSAQSHTPALASPQSPWAQQPAHAPRGAFQQQSPAPSSQSEASTEELSPATAEGEAAPADVIQQILLLQKPGPVQSWWDAGPSGEQFQQWTHPLSEWELKYIQAMSAETVPEPIRMWPLVTPERLTPEQTADMEKRLGAGAADAEGYCHWENRRRIIKHYKMTHPATLRLLLGLYRVTRDSNPLHFALERGWQMGSGQELFTAGEVSRLDAAQEFFTALAVGVASGRLMTATRPVPGWGVPEPVQPVGPSRVQPPRAPPRAVEPAPELVPAPAPEPAPAPAPPAPAPGPLAPSAELVEALADKNPTPQVPAGPRLPQDAAVTPKLPRLLKTDRRISPSSSQNAQLQADIDYLKELGAKNIRVNQQQLTFKDGQRVGINRPDLQFDHEGRRYHVEYDSPASGRGLGHQSRLTANDPDADVILLIIH